MQWVSKVATGRLIHTTTCCYLSYCLKELVVVWEKWGSKVERVICKMAAGTRAAISMANHNVITSDTTEKDKNIQSIVGPGSSFRTDGPSNLYQRPSLFSLGLILYELKSEGSMWRPHTSVCLSICLTIFQWLVVCWIFMKFGIGIHTKFYWQWVSFVLHWWWL
jgi:hypothetical protein